MPEEYIRTGEFVRTMDTLDKKIDAGFEGLHDRFNALEPTVLDHAKKIAVLEFQASQAFKTATIAHSAVESNKEAILITRNKVSNRAAAWGSGAAGLVWVLIEFGKALKTYMTGH